MHPQLLRPEILWFGLQIAFGDGPALRPSYGVPCSDHFEADYVPS
jgi:hypothetical protein